MNVTVRSISLEYITNNTNLIQNATSDTSSPKLTRAHINAEHTTYRDLLTQFLQLLSTFVFKVQEPLGSNAHPKICCLLFSLWRLENGLCFAFAL